MALSNILTAMFNKIYMFFHLCVEPKVNRYSTIGTYLVFWVYEKSEKSQDPWQRVQDGGYAKV